MPGFDITSILDFKPPTYLCVACRGLFTYFKTSRDQDGRPDWNVCPVCGVEYVSGEYDLDKVSASKYLRDHGHTIAYGGDLFQHARELALLVTKSRAKLNPWPTMRLLLEVLSVARYFVHFATWGISHQLIGALKLASVRVPVYGFVSNVEAHARLELSDFPDETPNFVAKVVPSRSGAWDSPHQKLLVVDGLLAFKGSTNLTNNALRKADRGLDISEVVTNFRDVTTLNNTYFAPIWKNLTSTDSTFFKMYDESPF